MVTFPRYFAHRCIYNPFSIICQRAYVSRAHPTPTPSYPVIEALNLVITDVKRRRKKRLVCEKFYNKRRAYALAGENVDPKYEGKEMPPWTRKHPDETIELVLNLNLDPRKPGQSLRGSVQLPHGTGRKSGNCVAFSLNEDAQAKALAAGASHAGGEELIDQIIQGDIPIDTIEYSAATKDILPILTRKAARLMGPRKILPNIKDGTLVETTDELVGAVVKQVSGKEFMYRTEKEGIIHAIVGKESFGVEKLLDNVGAFMRAIFDVRPDNYGRGKVKKGKRKKGQAEKKTQPQYLLRTHLTSSQGPSFRVDIRTVDPSSPFFLSSDELLDANVAEAA